MADRKHPLYPEREHEAESAAKAAEKSMFGFGEPRWIAPEAFSVGIDAAFGSGPVGFFETGDDEPSGSAEVKTLVFKDHKLEQTHRSASPWSRPAPDQGRLASALRRVSEILRSPDFKDVTARKLALAAAEAAVWAESDLNPENER